MTIRFGTMQAPGSAADWLETARNAERQGYHTILMPDTLRTASPFPALAAAAAVTTALRVRPNVIAAPLRTIATTVREIAALQQLSGGRFELGIGIGRPDALQEAEKLGLPGGSASRRRAHLIETVAAVRAEVDPAPPVMIAASGPRMLAAAGRIADRVLPALYPTATESELADMVATVRKNADRPVAFTTQLIGIGDQLAPPPGNWQVPTVAELRAVGSVGLLPADPGEAVAVLEHRRDAYGIDEVIVPGALAEAFQPILDRLR
ncbi:LLM class flavin-dependent oxidoreductase [Nocardia vaccinii]|uniref:LLM class flavin-dependent oxidoreductase n=1 Tax=Nocardia vaccinii TaxID=1822 RepID=UPI00083728DB|nr:LLM class flavin-dependent oxidoreductase [Nocardia vaccinii]